MNESLDLDELVKPPVTGLTNRYVDPNHPLTQALPELARKLLDYYKTPGDILQGRSLPVATTPGQWSDVDEAVAQATQGTVAERAAGLSMDAMTGGIPLAKQGAAGVFGGRLTQTAKPKLIPVEGNPFIRAYHGSPHDFDKFSMEHIGEGEGAQAYGHGLYFAGNEATAKAYREKLAGPQTTLGKGAQNLIDEYGSVEAASRAIKERLARFESYGTGDTDNARWLRDVARHLDDRLPTAPGRMYEVNINAHPEQFLDWDKPLVHQSPDVLNALRGVPSKAGVGSLDDPRRTGQAAYEFLSGQNWTSAAKNKYGYDAMLTKAQASAALRDAGTPGIKYLDQGSRNTGQGTSNYVLFRDDIIDIIKKYGLAGISMLPPTLAAQIQGMFTPVDHDPFTVTVKK